MKKLSCIIILISIIFIISSCSQKLPLPTLNKAGLLIIPTTCQNFTPYQYGYYYTFVYNPETQIRMKIVPLGSRKFAIIDGFPPGKYEINGIKSISSPTEGVADVSVETIDFSRSIPIEIRLNEITLLNYMFSVEQKFQSPNDVYRYYQGFYFQQLDDSQHKQIISDLQSLPNAELWNTTQLSATSITDQGNGVVSVNELYLSWRPSWRQD